MTRESIAIESSKRFFYSSSYSYSIHHVVYPTVSKLTTVLDTNKRNMRKSTNGEASHIATHPHRLPQFTITLIIKLHVLMIAVMKGKQRGSLADVTITLLIIIIEHRTEEETTELKNIVF